MLSLKSTIIFNCWKSAQNPLKTPVQFKFKDVRSKVTSKRKVLRRKQGHLEKKYRKWNKLNIKCPN